MKGFSIENAVNSLQNLNGDSNINEGDQTITSLYHTLNSKFQEIISAIKQNNKICEYFEEINISEEQILASYTFIIETNKSLIERSKKNKVIQKNTQAYFDIVITFLTSKNMDNLDAKGKAVWILEIQIKLKCCCSELFTTFKDHFDITNSPRKDYPKVWERIKIEEVNDVSQIKKEYKSLKNKLHIITSAVLNETEHEFSIVQKATFGLSCTKYLVMNDSSKLRSFLFYRKPTLEIAQKVWNLPEEGATKHLTKVTFDSIKTNLKLFIPANGHFNPNINIFEERPDTITVRILYHRELIKYPGQESMGCCGGQTPKDIKFIDEAMIHMHGGGFVALSSRSTQNYTRKWAKELRIPIISVDYRMPPSHPFPQAPEDCLTVYRFVLNHLDHYVNIKPAKIYLAGDSAGGNLTLSLTGLLMKNKEPLPMGLFVAYPATDLRKTFSVSRLHSITDPLLWPSMLMLCLDSYLKGDHKQADSPEASPILLTQQYVGGAAGDKRFPLNWPRTIVTVGNKDPLYDDSLLLMQKMVESNIDCQCTIYDGMSHGFLSTEMFIEQSSKTISNSIQKLKQLLGQQQNKK